MVTPKTCETGDSVWGYPTDDALRWVETLNKQETTMTRNWRDEILRAKSLDDLCHALNDMEDLFEEDCGETGQPACVLAGISENELCDLPIFGGEEPADTTGIWSWDEANCLVFENVWELQPRPEDDEDDEEDDDDIEYYLRRHL
jgi:hypothetical protein